MSKIVSMALVELRLDFESFHDVVVARVLGSLLLKIVVVDGGSPDPDRQTPAFLPTIAPHVTAKALRERLCDGLPGSRGQEGGAHQLSVAHLFEAHRLVGFL